jgi:hypothetical protein
MARVWLAPHATDTMRTEGLEHCRGIASSIGPQRPATRQGTKVFWVSLHARRPSLSPRNGPAASTSTYLQMQLRRLLHESDQSHDTRAASHHRAHMYAPRPSSPWQPRPQAYSSPLREIAVLWCAPHATTAGIVSSSSSVLSCTGKLKSRQARVFFGEHRFSTEANVVLTKHVFRGVLCTGRNTILIQKHLARSRAATWGMHSRDAQAHPTLTIAGRKPSDTWTGSFWLS